jgi:hypothetical protein
MPGLNPDVEGNMLQFMDGRTLVSWSGVSKYASLFLSNDKFKFLFTTRYPQLLAHPSGYAILTELNPGNCWKVLCSELSSPREEFPTPSVHFLQETCESKSKQLVARCKEICGEGYKEAASPVHENSLLAKAKKAHDTSEAECQVLQVQFIGLINSLKETHTASQIRDLCYRFIDLDPKQLETEQTLSGALIGRMILHPEFSQIYLSIARIQKQLIKVYNERDRCGWEYIGLYQDYCNCVRKQNEANVALKSLKGHSFKDNALIADHLFDLRIKLDSNKRIVQLPSKIQILKECSIKINNVLSKKQESPASEEDLSAIREAINSDPDEAALIWKSLYDRCGNNIIKDYWAENNFSGHLQDLAQLVKDRETMLEANLREAKDELNNKEGVINSNQFDEGKSELRTLIRDFK